MIIPIFIIDNRQSLNKYQSFTVEASLASYNRNVHTTLSRYISLCTQHPFLSSPSGIAVASSPDRVNFIVNKSINLIQLNDLVQPKYSCVGGANIPLFTWNRYIIDGLNKIFNNLDHERNRKTDKVSKKCKDGEKYLLTIFSHDLNLFGDESSESILLGVKSIITICKSLKSNFNVETRIISTILLDAVDKSSYFENKNLETVMTTLKQEESAISFNSIWNNHIHFEDELRSIIRLCAPIILSTIEFPILHNNKCSVMMEFAPGSLSSAQAIHEGLKSPQLFSMVDTSI